MSKLQNVVIWIREYKSESLRGSFVICGIFLLLFMTYFLLQAIIGVIASFTRRLLEQIINNLLLEYYFYPIFTRGFIAIFSLLFWFLAIKLIVNKHLREYFHLYKKKEIPILVFVGVGVSFVGLSSVFLIETNMNFLVVETWKWNNTDFLSLSSLIFIALALNLFVAFFEELTFRGFLVTKISEAVNEKYAIIVSAILFSAVHLLSNEAEGVNLVILFIMLLFPGVILAYAYLKTQSLIYPICLHFAHDLFATELYNLSGWVSDSIFGAQTTLNGPIWLIGNSWGIETGLIVIIPYSFWIIGIYFILNLQSKFIVVREKTIGL
ncbi:MAG: lysostaphin resistance A-like protein [Promethearchaeota archaeon]